MEDYLPGEDFATVCTDRRPICPIFTGVEQMIVEGVRAESAPTVPPPPRVSRDRVFDGTVPPPFASATINWITGFIALDIMIG